MLFTLDLDRCSVGVAWRVFASAIPGGREQNAAVPVAAIRRKGTRRGCNVVVDCHAHASPASPTEIAALLG